MTAVAVLGTAAAIWLQVRSQLQMRAAEDAAAKTVAAIVEAQRTFRRAAGGYATDLSSLTQACGGQMSAPLAQRLEAADYDYRVVLRASVRALPAGTDCHGRPVVTDFYVATYPAHTWAGRQAMAATGRGRVYVFFDGIAPVERDMEAGGLAVPLDTLDTFKIP